MDESKLREIEERAAKATSGPWVYFGEPEDNVFWGEIRSAAEDGGFEHIADTPELDERSNDMEFIAHAREDVPVLCRAIREEWRERQRFINAFRDTAIKAHIGFRHQEPWERCGWISCADRRQLIAELTVSTAAVPA